MTPRSAVADATIRAMEAKLTEQRKQAWWFGACPHDDVQWLETETTRQRLCRRCGGGLTETKEKP